MRRLSTTALPLVDETPSLIAEKQVKELCEQTPLSELTSVPMVDLAETTEIKLSQRIEEAQVSGFVDAAVADSGRTQSSKVESGQSELSTAAPVVEGSASDRSASSGEKAKAIDPKQIGTLNPFYFDSLNPPEYYEDREIKQHPITGYYIPPKDLIKWDLAEEERAVFLTEQQVYLADVAKGGHYEAACAAIKRIHALERGIKLAAHAVFSLRQSFIEDSLHKLSAGQKAEYDKLDVEEKEKYLKKVARKPKMPGLVNKTGEAVSSESKSAQAKLAAAARSQAKKIIDGYYQLALSEEQDMADAAKEVMKKLENKGLLTDIAKMMIKKLFV